MKLQLKSLTRRKGIASLAVLLAVSTTAFAYTHVNGWGDATDIVIDNAFNGDFNLPAENMLARWDAIDTTDGSHPFRKRTNPIFNIQPRDQRSTMGFLSEADAMARYEGTRLHSVGTLAFTACFASDGERFFPQTKAFVECDVVVDAQPEAPWELNEPAVNESASFRSVLLHELGHVRGLNHGFDDRLEIMQPFASRVLGPTVYSDDRFTISTYNTIASYSDLAAFNRSTAAGQSNRFTFGPTTVRSGGIMTFTNVTYQNLSPANFPSPVRLGLYLSTDAVVTAGDTLVSTGSFPLGFRPFQTSNPTQLTGIAPNFGDCTTRFAGTVIDDNLAFVERDENNNGTVFVDAATGAAQAISILLPRDALEPNDSLAQATPIPFASFSRGGLNLDVDQESDYFKVEVPQGGSLSATISFTHSSGDIDLHLLNSSGLPLSTSAGTGNTESVSASNLAAGTYYLRAFGFGVGSCNASYTIATTGTGPVPSASMSDAELVEGNSGTRLMQFTATLSNPTNREIILRLISTDGTATIADNDYGRIGFDLVFAPNEVSKTFSVVINGDTRMEPDETFNIVIDKAFGSVLGDGAVTVADGIGVGTIIDDDAAPVTASITADESSFPEGTDPNNFTIARFTARLSAPSTQDVTVNFQPVSGTATEGSDFIGGVNPVTIPAGATSAPISVAVIADAVTEPDETFSVQLVSVDSGPALIGTPASAQVTLVNDDAATGTPGIRTNVTSFNFGSVKVGQSSVQRMLVITNTGTAPLRITGIRLAGDYTGSSGCSAPVAPGATCTLTGSFRPTATGPRPGSVTITSNAPSSPTVVTLSGTGT